MAALQNNKVLELNDVLKINTSEIVRVEVKMKTMQDQINSLLGINKIVIDNQDRIKELECRYDRQEIMLQNGFSIKGEEMKKFQEDSLLMLKKN